MLIICLLTPDTVNPRKYIIGNTLGSHLPPLHNLLITRRPTSSTRAEMTDVSDLARKTRVLKRYLYDQLDLRDISVSCSIFGDFIRHYELQKHLGLLRKKILSAHSLHTTVTVPKHRQTGPAHFRSVDSSFILWTCSELQINISLPCLISSRNRNCVNQACVTLSKFKHYLFIIN